MILDIAAQDTLLQFAVGDKAWMGQAFPLAREKQVGLHCQGLQPDRSGVPWCWGPLHCSPEPHQQLGELLPTVPQSAGSKWVRGPGASLGHGPGKAMWVPTAPTTHGMRVVKTARTACAKGALRGKISAHGAKESCFNWEGKEEECKNHRDIPFPTGLPVISSFFREKNCTFGKGFE